ncbi:MAG: class I SAM-dependent methyltransferase [Candidatus Baltobacteraceae bacterium]
MSARSTILAPGIQAYIESTMVSEAPVLAKLRAETAALPNAQMQIGADQGQFMQMLVRLLQAKRYLEIGVFTGYSSLAVALALPPSGLVLACDINETYTSVARRYWKEGGVASKVDLRIGPAAATMEELVTAGQAGAFDLAFIDADKANVDVYYEYALRLLRKNGIMLVDNVLWSGAVLDLATEDEDTRALHAINMKAANDERVDASLLPIGDGLLMARKR